MILNTVRQRVHATVSSTVLFASRNNTLRFSSRGISTNQKNLKAFNYEEHNNETSLDLQTFMEMERQRGELSGNHMQDPDSLLEELDPKAFGTLVESDPTLKSNEELYENADTKYRDPETGLFRHGEDSQEARLDRRTYEGMVNHRQVRVPGEVAKAIENNILRIHNPKFLKQKVADYYVKLDRTELHFAANTEIDTDAQIGATFIRDYASVYQVLHELRKRIGADKFNPKSVLDYGYGPATGMLALNELMGDEFNPRVKDVVVNGSFYMERRAKILLSRQQNEYHPRDQGANEEEEQDTAAEYKMYDEKYEDELETKETDNQEEIETESEDEYVGRVKTKSIKIKTIISDRLRPESKKYDLIIAQHQLLMSRTKYPLEVDNNINKLISRLAPGGHLVLLERGTPLGSESIKRARQVLFRPESNEGKLSKTPRLFKRFMVPGEMMTKAELGDVEPELLESFHVFEDMSEEEVVNLSIVAPCSHHGKCPLQFSKPEYYDYGGIGKKLIHCSFKVNVERPRFMLQLKRGGTLSAEWNDEFKSDSPKGFADAGTGRVGGRNFETANFSYLVIERSHNDAETLQTIEEAREKETAEVEAGNVRQIGHVSETLAEAPRILFPLKKKGFVAANVCAPSGHLEKIFISKSYSRQGYHDARKIQHGDLWALGFKSATQSTKENTFYLEALKQKTKNIRDQRKKEAKALKKKNKNAYKLMMKTEAKGFKAEIQRAGEMAEFELYNNPKVKKYFKRIGREAEEAELAGEEAEEAEEMREAVAKAASKRM